MPWRGDYLWSAELVGSNSFPAILASAMAVAVDVWRTLAPERASLVATGDLRGRFLATYGGLIALGIAIPVLVAFGATMTTWTDVPFFWGAFEPLRLWSVAYVFVSLLSIFAILCVCFLLALATNVAALVVVPVAALWMTYTAMSQSGLVVLGATTGSMVGFQPDGWSLLVQTVFSVAVITLSCWAGPRWPAGCWVTSWPGIGVLALLLIVGSSNALGLREYAPSYVHDFQCTGNKEDVKVCVSEQHSRFLSPLYVALIQLQDTAEMLGVRDAVPDTVVESYTLFESNRVEPDLRISADVAGWRPTSDELKVRNPQISNEYLLAALTYPDHCPQMSAEEPPSDKVFETQDRAQAAGLRMLDQTVSVTERQKAAQDYRKDVELLRSCKF